MSPPRACMPWPRIVGNCMLGSAVYFRVRGLHTLQFHLRCKSTRILACFAPKIIDSRVLIVVRDCTEDGVKHTHVQFYLKGSNTTGTVKVDACKVFSSPPAPCMYMIFTAQNKSWQDFTRG